MFKCFSRKVRPSTSVLSYRFSFHFYLSLYFLNVYNDQMAFNCNNGVSNSIRQSLDMNGKSFASISPIGGAFEYITQYECFVSATTTSTWLDPQFVS